MSAAPRPKSQRSSVRALERVPVAPVGSGSGRTHVDMAVEDQRATRAVGPQVATTFRVPVTSQSKGAACGCGAKARRPSGRRRGPARSRADSFRPIACPGSSLPRCACGAGHAQTGPRPGWRRGTRPSWAPLRPPGWPASVEPSGALGSIGRETADRRWRSAWPDLRCRSCYISLYMTDNENIASPSEHLPGLVRRPPPRRLVRRRPRGHLRPGRDQVVGTLAEPELPADASAETRRDRAGLAASRASARTPAASACRSPTRPSAGSTARSPGARSAATSGICSPRSSTPAMTRLRMPERRGPGHPGGRRRRPQPQPRAGLVRAVGLRAPGRLAEGPARRARKRWRKFARTAPRPSRDT